MTDEAESHRPAGVPDDAEVAYDDEDSYFYWRWEECGAVRERYKEAVWQWADSYPPR